MSNEIDASRVHCETQRSTPRVIDVTTQFLSIFERRAEIELRILIFMGGTVLGTLYGVGVALSVHS